MQAATRLVLACLTVAALAAAGCGGGDGAATSRETASLLADTFGAGKSVRSGRIDLTLDVSAKGLPNLREPLVAHVTGPFQSSGTGKAPKFAFDLDLASGGSKVKAGAISTGAKGYLTFAERAYALPDGAVGALRGAGKPGTGLSLGALGIDPRRWLRDPRREGEDDVGGVRTIHLAAGVDVTRLLADVDRLLAKAGSSGVTGATGAQVPAALDADTRRTIERSIRSATVDVWTGREDHTLRRIAVDVRFDVPADERAKGSAPQTGRVRFDLAFADLNREQAIGAPAHARPVSELASAMRQVLSAGNHRYEQCVQDAGVDLAKAQGCAGLVGQ
jgi:hypothetical protein